MEGKELEDVKKEIKTLKERCDKLEEYNTLGVSDGSYYLCKDDATYSGPNTDKITIVKGKITKIG